MKKHLLHPVIFLFCLNPGLHAQSGRLDSAFGKNGKVFTRFNFNDAIASCVAMQGDKIVVPGSVGSNVAVSGELEVARYNEDGSLDTSFARQGKKELSFGDQVGFANAVAMQSNEEIVIALGRDDPDTSGYLSPLFSVIRLHKDGALDKSFGNGGIYTFSEPEGEAVTIAIQPDQKILAGGWEFLGTGDFRIVLVRLKTNGTPDSSFGNSGMAFYGGMQSIYKILMQKDGKILAIGGDFESTYMTLCRFNSYGTIDSTFGTNGTVKIGFNSYPAYGISLALQSDGKIIALGASDHEDQYVEAIVLARLNPNGSYDSTFGTNGIAIPVYHNNQSHLPTDLLIYNDKILVGGTAELIHDGNGRYTYALFLYNTDGSLDSAFCNNGMLVTEFQNGFEIVYGMTIQPDNKVILVGGDNTAADTYRYAITRYILDLDIGNVSFTNNPVSSCLIYPNPIHQVATLKYSLIQSENLSINLLDVNGRLVKSFLTNQRENKGKYSEQLNFDSWILNGTYILSISNGIQSENIKLIKN